MRIKHRLQHTRLARADVRKADANRTIGDRSSFQRTNEAIAQEWQKQQGVIEALDICPNVPNHLRFDWSCGFSDLQLVKIVSGILAARDRCPDLPSLLDDQATQRTRRSSRNDAVGTGYPGR
ncbi:hypothetical protein [Bradyrhizobium sp.]|uniref:hypothetical protein n=1 Tax=Bradyrhizobium sp. TaxID=376 RepID=UPI003C53BA56